MTNYNEIYRINAYSLATEIHLKRISKNLRELKKLEEFIIDYNKINQIRLERIYYDDQLNTSEFLSLSRIHGQMCLKFVNQIDRQLLKLKQPVKTKTPYENRAAYANRRNDYLKKYNRKVFERDNWICTKCGNLIRNKTDARAYDLFLKFHLSTEFAFEECFITLCHTCYSNIMGTYSTSYCDCARKYPPYRDCRECMVPPSLKELLETRIGKDHERWLNVEF